MKTAIYFIFIIIWAVLQARRKAMRAQKRKAAEAERTSPLLREKQPQPVARGPVTAEENRLVPESVSIDEPGTVPNEALEQPSYLERAPREVQDFIERARTKKRKKEEQPDVAQEEKVEEIVSPVALEPDAYAQNIVIRRDIGFDPASLRTFIITREILGPPRAKHPHRPGVQK